MEREVVIDVVERSDAIRAYLPPSRRVLQAALAARSSAFDEPDPAIVKALISRAEDIERLDTEIRARREERLVFFIRPYTYGERAEATRSATTWVDGRPRFEDELFREMLLIKCVRLQNGSFAPAGSPPPLVEILWAELVVMSEPDWGRVDFFD